MLHLRGAVAGVRAMRREERRPGGKQVVYMGFRGILLFIPPFWKTRGVYSFSTDDSKIIPKKTKKVKRG